MIVPDASIVIDAPCCDDDTAMIVSPLPESFAYTSIATGVGGFAISKMAKISVTATGMAAPSQLKGSVNDRS